MSSISFLQNISVAAAEGKPAGAVRNTAKKQRQPDAAKFAIRVWKDGSIYPSDALIKQFNLEYSPKGAETVGNGFDVAQASDMPKQITTPQDFLCIGATSKSEPKVDLFASCSYDKEGNPAKGVANQGAFSFGETVLLPLIKEVYNVEPNAEGFIDLVVVTESAITSPNGIFNIPKRITKGARAGETGYERRENLTLFPLVPATMVESNEAVPAENGSTSEDNDLVAAEEVVQLPEANGSVNIAEDAEQADPIDYSASEYDEAPVQEDPFATK